MTYQSHRYVRGATQQTGPGFLVPAAGGGGSSLLTSLVASWKLDDLTDATGRGNTLTNNNTVTFNTGKIGNAAYMASASTQWLSIATNSDVAQGDFDYTIGVWIYIGTISDVRIILARDSDTSGREFELEYDGSGDSFRFVIFTGGSTKTAQVVSPYTPSTAGRWICLIAWHDAAANTVNLSIDNGAASDSQPTTGGHDTSTGNFTIGRRIYSGFEGYWDGRIDDVNIWKKVLSAGERTEFYNSGTGKEHPFT